MLIFCFDRVFFWFRTHVAATTVCTTGVYIHSLVARTFSCAQRAHCVLRTLLMRVSHTHGSRVCKKGVCTCVVFSPSRLLPSLVSPIFCCLRTTTLSRLSVHTFLPYLLVPKAQGMRISARGREVWLSGQVRPQHRL